MENLGKVTLFIISLVCSFLVSILQSHIVLSIAGLYQLEFVTKFTFIQIFGILILIDLVKYTYKKSVTEENEASFINKMIEPLISRLLLVLLVWGIAFVAYDLLR